MKKGTSSRKILLCTLLISLAAILLSYLGFVIYFSNHFLFHTEINGIDASGMTVKSSRRFGTPDQSRTGD